MVLSAYFWLPLVVLLVPRATGTEDGQTQLLAGPSFWILDLHVIQVAEPSCGRAGHFFAGENCILLIEKLGTDCPRDFKKIGNACANETPIICPKDTQLVGRRCVKNDTCPTGYRRLHQNVCISQRKLCPDGNTTSDGSCKDSIPKCHLEFKLSNGLCKNDTYLKCKDGYVMLHGKCVASCPDDHAVYRQRCHRVSEGKCPEEFYQHPSRGCVLKLCQMTSYSAPACSDETGCPPGFFSKSDDTCIDKCLPGWGRVRKFCLPVRKERCQSNEFELGERLCILECPQGFANDLRRCRRNVGCKDPQRNILLNNHCVSKCPSNFIHDINLGKCIRKCPPPNFYFKDSCNNRRCPRGYSIDFRIRACVERLKCNRGYKKFLSKYCVKRCPISYREVGKNCLRASRCRSGIKMNGHCVDNCPTGTEQIGGHCESVTYGQCGANMVLHICHPKAKSCHQRCVCKRNYRSYNKGTFRYCLPRFTAYTIALPWDIVFVIDASNTTANKTFNAFLRTIADSLVSLGSECNKMNVAFVLTGSNPPKMVYFTLMRNPTKVLQATSQLRLSSENLTDLATGTRIVNDVILKDETIGARPKVAKMIILLTTAKVLRNDKIRGRLWQELRRSDQKKYKTAIISVGLLKDLPNYVKSFFMENADMLPKLVDSINAFLQKEAACPKGYIVKQAACEDINECDNPKACHKTATCINSPGSFHCICPTGLDYIDPTQGCVNKTTQILNYFQPCSKLNCTGDAKCTVEHGRAFCACPKGLVYNKDAGCEDFNECQGVSSHFQSPCQPGAQCINLVGSFRCVCPPGYRYTVSFGCIDIDECKETVTSRPPCANNSRCVNNHGSFTCVCPRGYQYDRDRGCQDINECLTKTLPCSGDAACKNTIGSFQCVCPTDLVYSPGVGCDLNESASIFRLTLRCWILVHPNVLQSDGPAVRASLTDLFHRLAVDTSAVRKEIRIGTDPWELILANGTPVYEQKRLQDSLNDLKSKSIRPYHIGHVTTEWARVINSVNRRTNDHLIAIFKGDECIDIETKIKMATASSLLLVIIGGPSAAVRRHHNVSAGVETLHLTKSRYLRQFGGNLMAQHVMEKLTCMDGFVFTGNLCKNKNSIQRYCSFGNHCIPPGQTLTYHCAVYGCSQDGDLQLKERKCRGFDGDCYLEDAVFPCWRNGERHDMCKCKTRLAQADEIFRAGQLHMATLYIIYQPEKQETDNGQHCHFPFKFQNKWRYSCLAWSGRPWCSLVEFYKPFMKLWSRCKSKSYSIQCHDPITKKSFNEGQEWSHKCNKLTCTNTGILIKPGCETTEQVGCVAKNTDGYSCVIGGHTEKRCHCGLDDKGFGRNEAIGTSCRTSNNGVKGIGETWYVGCNRYYCSSLSTTVILERGCQDATGKCHAPLSSETFECVDTRSNVRKKNCRCVLDALGNTQLNYESRHQNGKQ